jgi:hypothetical protein
MGRPPPPSRSGCRLSRESRLPSLMSKPSSLEPLQSLQRRAVTWTGPATVPEHESLGASVVGAVGHYEPKTRRCDDGLTTVMLLKIIGASLLFTLCSEH